MTHLFRYPTIGVLAQYLSDDASKTPSVSITESQARGTIRKKKMLRRRKMGIPK
jgi:hypothetical protein